MSEEKKYILAEADYIAGMKYKDIAAKYEVTINTVKSWKTRYKWSKTKKKVCTQNKKVCTQKEAVAEDSKEVLETENLTDKQRLFCCFYIRCFNATKAYQKAYGVSYLVAAAAGSRLLKSEKIQNTIRELKQNRMNREMLSEEDVFQMYLDIAFANITDYASFGTKKVVDDKTGEEYMISFVNLNDSKEVDGTLISEVSKGRDGVKIKLVDKMKALQWLSDHMDMATEKQKAEIALLRTKVQTDGEEEIEDDGFLDALKEEALEVWENEE